MARVVLKNATKIYPGGVVGAKNISLDVADKEFCVLVGPSGCGKSTTLRMVAGLEEVTEGEIYIDDKLVNDIPPKERDIAMVFQNYALYPHMTAYENMAFALKLRRYPREEIQHRVEEAADILGIRPLLNRRPKALSGGERQRVAVGRAIVRKPKVFLFDEPLSNLDAKMRVQMRTELSKLHDRLQATMIYVTHDQVEAMTMGDKIAILKDGIIHQVADPITLYDHPKNKFVAGFIGTPPMNFMGCRVIKKEGGIYLDEGSYEVKVSKRMEKLLEPYIGKEVVFGIRPEDIYDKLYSAGATRDNTISAVVEVVEPMGAEILLHMATGRSSFIARVGSHNKAKVHQDIEMVFDMDKIHIFDKETEKAIV